MADATPSLKQTLKKTKLWKSIFRHDFSDTPRTRLLRVFGNVFLHLHPVRIAKDAIRIPYTWGEREGNRLNAYYGMQAFAPWGLSAMVPLGTGVKKPVYVGRSRPEESAGQWRFDVQVDGPIHRRETIPTAGTFVIDYERVYGGPFRNGRRLPQLAWSVVP
jgi:hypothetical protein